MTTAPVTGMLVGSNVRLMYLLGRGGMGSVWVAEHLLLQIDVAVKFLAPELTSVPEARARFEREAAAAAQLKNRHVVQIFDRGVTEHGLPYIVMELLVGEDLGKHIERAGPRPLEQVVTIVTQMARALKTAHTQGVVHRDIKPENVFLIDAERDLFVKLLDFGIAKRTQDAAWNVTSTNIMMGTPHFMSPEQLMSPKDVNFHADLWSVAVVAYVALTGIPPFDGATIGSLCVAVNSGDFQPVTRWRKDLPAALDGWFQRAFQRDPAHRFGSIEEMALALQLAAGTSQPGLGSMKSPTPVGSGGNHRAFPSTSAPALSDTALKPETPYQTSVTPSPTSKRSRAWVVLAVIGVSMLSSAATTLLFLGPSSFQVFGAIARDVLGAGAEPPAHASSAADAPVSEGDASVTAGVEPVVEPAAFPEMDSVEIQASKPERAPHQRSSGASLPTAPPAGAGAQGSQLAPASRLPERAPGTTPEHADHQRVNGEESAEPGAGAEGAPDSGSDTKLSAPDDGPDYGF